MKFIFAFLTIGLLSSCHKYRPWIYSKTIPISNTGPIGLVEENGVLWVSDGDHNRLVKINLEGQILDGINGFDRPMHMDKNQGRIYVPNYGSDKISVLEKDRIIDSLDLVDTLDAPSGISVVEQNIAIADFYNHRILYFNGSNWNVIGKKGSENGTFHYPTDVQIFKDKIYVADAYNHRVQVFDKQGSFLQVIGVEEQMNGSTGVYVSESGIIYVTDFENNKVHIYNNKGERKQSIEKGLNKPIDLLEINGKLVVLNFNGHSMTLFTR